MEQQNKDNNMKLRIITSSITIVMAITLILYLSRQAFISYNSRARISIAYGVFYHISLVIELVFLAGVVCVCFLSPDNIIYKKMIQIYKRNLSVFRIIKYSTVAIVSSLIFVFVLLIGVSPIKNDSIHEISVLYDNGTLNEMIVKPLFTPLALALKETNLRISIFPLNRKNIIESLDLSKYLFVL
jgi:hypothetical protein